MAIVGMVPAEAQLFTVYAGAVSARSGQAEAAAALLHFLASAAGRAVLARRGMLEP